MAKYFVAFIIIAILLGAYLTYRVSSDPTSFIPQIVDEESSMEDFDFQNWKEYESPKGAFTVLLPSHPHHVTEKSTDEKTGENRVYDMYVSEKPDGTVFMINLITMEKVESDQDKERAMRKMMNDMVESNPTNALRSVEKGKFQGYNTLDYAFGNEKTAVEARSFFVNDTLYILTRASHQERPNTKEYTFFINSFSLNEKTD